MFPGILRVSNIKRVPHTVRNRTRQNKVNYMRLYWKATPISNVLQAKRKFPLHPLRYRQDKNIFRKATVTKRLCEDTSHLI